MKNIVVYEKALNLIMLFDKVMLKSIKKCESNKIFSELLIIMAIQKLYISLNFPYILDIDRKKNINFDYIVSFLDDFKLNINIDILKNDNYFFFKYNTIMIVDNTGEVINDIIYKCLPILND